jgi:two-component system sensor histidine kinase DctS
LKKGGGIMKQIPILWKITVLSYAVVVFSLLIGGLVVIVNIQEVEERQLRLRSMNTARTVAELSDIKKGVQKPEGWKTVNPIAEKFKL